MREWDKPKQELNIGMCHQLVNKHYGNSVLCYAFFMCVALLYKYNNLFSHYIE